jgi:hypothetical protein
MQVTHLDNNKQLEQTEESQAPKNHKANLLAALSIHKQNHQDQHQEPLYELKFVQK